MSRVTGLFLQFRDRDRGRKNRQLLLGFFNEGKNANRDQDQDRGGGGNDFASFALRSGHVDHVAASQFFVGSFQFGNELVVR